MKTKKDFMVFKSNLLINKVINCNYNKNELRLICYLISQIKPKQQLFDEKVVDVKNFFKMDKINTKYINKFITDLESKVFYILNRDTFQREPLRWFEYISYKNGVITCKLDDELKPYLLNLKNNTTQYPYSLIEKLDDTYSILMLELLKANLKLGYRRISLDDLKDYLQIPNSYTFTIIKNRILKVVQKNIDKNTDIKFEFTNILRGKKIEALNFIIIDKVLQKQREDEKLRLEQVKKEAENLSDNKKRMFDLLMKAKEKKSKKEV